MEYRNIFVLSPRSVHTPPLLVEIDNQCDSYLFDPGDRKSAIRFDLCPAAAKELEGLDFPALRRLLWLRHRIHPDAPIEFSLRTAGIPRQSILVQRGLK